MKYGKIMARDDLEIIMGRLTCCNTLLFVVHAAISDGDCCVDALSSVCDLLESICKDFQANIDAAEDYTGK